MYPDHTGTGVLRTGLLSLPLSSKLFVSLSSTGMRVKHRPKSQDISFSFAVIRRSSSECSKNDGYVLLFGFGAGFGQLSKLVVGKFFIERNMHDSRSHIIKAILYKFSTSIKKMQLSRFITDIYCWPRSRLCTQIFHAPTRAQSQFSQKSTLCTVTCGLLTLLIYLFFLC